VCVAAALRAATPHRAVSLPRMPKLERGGQVNARSMTGRCPGQRSHLTIRAVIRAAAGVDVGRSSSSVSDVNGRKAP
jgi:hypothetical protein